VEPSKLGPLEEDQELGEIAKNGVNLICGDLMNDIGLLGEAKGDKILIHDELDLWHESREDNGPWYGWIGYNWSKPHSSKWVR